MLNGSCHCDAVRVQASGITRDPAACHCSRCRRQPGQYRAAVIVPVDAFSVRDEVRWRKASSVAKRSVCPTRGSFLFRKDHAEDWPGLAPGALDGPTGVRLKRYVLTAGNDDYHDITDTVWQEEQEDE